MTSRPAPDTTAATVAAALADGPDDSAEAAPRTESQTEAAPAPRPGTEAASLLPAARPPASPPSASVISDEPLSLVRQPADLLGAAACLVGMILVCALVMYAHNTTEGITEDVRGFQVLLQRLLFFPVAILEVILVIMTFIVVSIDLIIRRHAMLVLQSLAAGIAGIVVNGGIALLLTRFAPESLLTGLLVPSDPYPTMPILVATVIAFLIVSDPAQRRLARWSWILLWIVVGVLCITGGATLPGMGLALLAGGGTGLVARYIAGVPSERAYGEPLLDGIRRAGYQPLSLIRIPLTPAKGTPPSHTPEPATTTSAHTPEPETTPTHTQEAAATTPADTPEPAAAPAEPAIAGSATTETASPPVIPSPAGEPGRTVPSTPDSRVGIQLPQFFTDHRLYLLETADAVYDVIVLDGDRQVVAMLLRLWRQLRRRGIDARRVTSLRQSAERAALVSYSVKAAGVHTPGVLALAEAEDSMLLVREPVPVSRCWSELAPEEIDDTLLDAMWLELAQAHRAGIVHRYLTDQSFRLQQTQSGDQCWWILGWEMGDVAAGELPRGIDLAQLMAVMAIKVGVERAVASASAMLSRDDLRSIVSLLQLPALPARLREQLRRGSLLAELRQAIIDKLPQTQVEPEQIVRVGARTVISFILTAIALFVILTSFNLAEVSQAIQRSDWRWALASLGFGLIATVGAAAILVAFSPVKINLLWATITQIAASYVAVSVPAGIGTAGLNIRLLTKKGVAPALATATAALIQVSLTVTTVLLLIIMTLVTGRNQATPFQVTPAILAVAIGLAVAVGAVFAIPQSRKWILGRIMPLLRQTWPRLVELFSSPLRLLIGIGGNVFDLVFYMLAFHAALLAFGQDISFVTSGISYLIGISVGSVAPTPGGIGAIEAADLGALATVGINAGVAASAVIVFRVATFWIRIPLGLIAYRWLGRRGDI